MAADEVLLNWLPSVPGLEPAAVDIARQLFSKHLINDAVLDFFVSEHGGFVLQEWQRKVGSVASESDEESAHRTGSAGPTPAASPATPQKSKKSAALRGRQQITRHERQQEGHYFAHKEIAVPRASGKDAVEKSSDSAKAGPSSEAARGTRATGGSSKRDHRLQEVQQGCPAEVSRLYSGTVKSFRKDTGYGFIHCPELGDVYLRDAELQVGVSRPEVGQAMQFSVVYNSKGQPQASNVSWHKVNQPPAFDVSRRFEGCLKSFSEDYGFVECAEAWEVFKRDVYISNDLMPATGCSLRQPVSFSIALNARNQPQAKSVVWGRPLSEVVLRPKLAQNSGQVSRW